jgi:2-hydroxychromene-2-carboxylate isomerase
METLIAILLWFGWISPNSTYSTDQINTIVTNQASTVQTVTQDPILLHDITVETAGVVPTVIIFDPDQD